MSSDNSDNYEFSKSLLEQSNEGLSPYSAADYYWVNDQTGPNYGNANGSTQVNFDLTSIFNNAKMCDFSKSYVAVPIVYTTGLSTSTFNGTMIAPTAATSPWAYCGPKNNFVNFVHSAELTLSGQPVEVPTNFSNMVSNFRMMSSMSQDDIASLGSSIGVSQFDNVESMRFNGPDGTKSTLSAGTAGNIGGTLVLTTVPGLVSGNGVVNNQPFAFAAGADQGDQALQAANQYNATYNNSYYKRLMRIVDSTVSTANAGSNMIGNTASQGIQGINNLNAEFRPYYVQIGNYAVVYDVLIIRLQDILQSVAQLPLTKRLDAMLRINFNTGYVGAQMVAAGANQTLITTGGTLNSFVNTCPIMISSLAAWPATTCGVVSSVGIGRSAPSNCFGINTALSTAQNPYMNTCRLYYQLITLQPERLSHYLSANRSKRVVYTAFLQNTLLNIPSGSQYSSLCQVGVKNIRGVLVIPFISAQTNGAINPLIVPTSNQTPFAQYSSPFDTCPSTTAPISLTNLQVQVGGSSILQNSPISTSFEAFTASSSFEKINGGTFGISNGLINQYQWENGFRNYYIDCSRSNLSDQMTMRQVNVAFTNNSLQTIDAMVFVLYNKSFIINCENGLVEME
jgi:hypothetical protein